MCGYGWSLVAGLRLYRRSDCERVEEWPLSAVGRTRWNGVSVCPWKTLVAVTNGILRPD